VGYGIAGLAYVGLVVAIITTQGWGLLALVAVQILMILVGAGLAESGESASAPVRYVIQAVRKLFESAAYEIVPVPSSGDPSIDPLLASVDMMARNGERTFAVRILTPERSGPAAAGQKSSNPQTAAVEWGEAAALQTAAWALSSISGSAGLPARTVEPLLVLAGVSPSDGLRAFCQDQALRLVEIDLDTVTRIHDTEPADELRAMAEQYLGLTAASAPGAAGQEAGQSA